MAKPTLTLTLNAQQWAIAQKRLQALNLGPGSLKKGTLPETSGVVLSYVVTENDAGAVVVVTVERKPFFVSVGMIEDKAKSLLAST